MNYSLYDAGGIRVRSEIVNRAVQTEFRSLLTSLRERTKPTLHIWSFLIAVAMCGLVFGGVTAGQLNQGDASVLGSAVSQLLQAVSLHQLAPAADLWWQRMVNDAQLLALIWLFGVSVIGLPLIVVVIFLRSFSVGFSIAFTVIQFGWKGFLFASIAIFLHQVVTMTVFIFAGTIAIRFSAGILRQVFPLQKLSGQFLKYTFLFALCAVGLMIGAGIEAYLAPNLLNTLLLGH